MLTLGRTAGIALAALPFLAPIAATQTPLTTVRVAAGLSRPVWVGSPPEDETRLFVAEQWSGRIKIIKDGHVLSTPFLDIKSKIQTGSEKGLLGVAFHPNYKFNRRFYVNYTRAPDGATIVEEYRAFANNPDQADPNSGVVILGPISQPFTNHNGGCIAFGPDKFLYVGMGDGGSAGDPQCRAQRGDTLLGKLLRIDVNNGGAAPPSNPFVGNPAFLDEIWALGLRNPWRFSFDRETGDLYIADVGQNAREEINYTPAGSTGGENYGWKIMEGTLCFSTSNCPPGVPPCNDPSLQLPIHEYSHVGGNCSVTGGYVYRGCAIPDLKGTYFFADFCSNRIWSFRVVNGQVTEFKDRTSELKPVGASIASISSFGEDACGELYICDLNGGEIFKIVPNAPAPYVDLGFSKPNGQGVAPSLTVCGLLDTGNFAEVRLRDGPSNRLTLIFASLTQNPVPTSGGTLVPDFASSLVLSVFTNGRGEWTLVAPGGGGVFDAYVQVLADDPTATFGVSFSNAIKMTFQP